ncbi:MAG: hypothetical protein ACTTKH_04935 [Treponema sp.]
MKSKIIFFALSLFIIALTSCKIKNELKEFVEKGFYQPKIDSDIKFTMQNIGDDGLIYVPSKQDITSSLNIENKYNLTFKTEIIIPEEKKNLFEKLPQFINIEPTKLELSFKFKEEAEPKVSNDFLGENVPNTSPTRFRYFNYL